MAEPVKIDFFLLSPQYIPQLSKMDLALNPETYSPQLDHFGKYSDKIPPLSPAGVRCPCGSRKAQTFTKPASLKSHFGTKTHRDWIYALNCAGSGEAVASAIPAPHLNPLQEIEQLKQENRSLKIAMGCLEQDNAKLRYELSLRIVPQTTPSMFTSDLLGLDD